MTRSVLKATSFYNYLRGYNITTTIQTNIVFDQVYITENMPSCLGVQLFNVKKYFHVMMHDCERQGAKLAIQLENV
jgi:hypothetical protein